MQQRGGRKGRETLEGRAFAGYRSVVTGLIENSSHWTAALTNCASKSPTARSGGQGWSITKQMVRPLPAHNEPTGARAKCAHRRCRDAPRNRDVDLLSFSARGTGLLSIRRGIDRLTLAVVITSHNIRTLAPLKSPGAHPTKPFCQLASWATSTLPSILVSLPDQEHPP